MTSTSQTRLALAVVSAAILFDALDLSITQVALPSIQSDLRISAASLQWVANAYVLTYGALLLLGGRLADLVGRRRIFVAGLVLFGAMSLACGLAPAPGALVAARALQGVGAALTVPAAVAIIATTFAEGEERNRALGVFGASASAGFSVGLVLGGVLTAALDWRWIFLVKVPVVLAVAALALRAVEPDPPASARRGYDARGAGLSVAGLLLTVLGITQLAARTLPIAALVAVWALALACLAAFVVNERGTAAPLLPFELFRMRVPRTADLASLTVLAAPFGFSFVTTLYLQRLLGWSPLATGLALLPGAALSIPVSRAVAPRLVEAFGLRAAGIGGLVLVSAGFALLLRIGAHAAYATVLLPAVLVCFGLGMGIAYPVYTIGAVAGVDDERQGVAAGIQNTALQVGGGLGLALVSAGVAASAGSPLAALRTGAAIGAALPLLGAAITFAAL